jgi:hypothetical protein
MGSRFPRASRNHRSYPLRSSRPPQKQNKGRTTRTSPQNKVMYPSSTPQLNPPTLGTTAVALIGPELYDRVPHLALKLYIAAAEHAAMRGLIIADTKFEFGLVDNGRHQLTRTDQCTRWSLKNHHAGSQSYQPCPSGPSSMPFRKPCFVSQSRRYSLSKLGWPRLGAYPSSGQ